MMEVLGHSHGGLRYREMPPGEFGTHLMLKLMARPSDLRLTSHKATEF